MDPSNQLALITSDNGHHQQVANHPVYASNASHQVISIATISSGFEKGDFLVREEKGQRVYFDFFEEALILLHTRAIFACHEKMRPSGWIR
jgi:hypothetical protein